MLKPGDVAPDFTLTGNDDQDHTLSAHKGHKVALMFYPADFSPVCEKQHACMVSDQKKFEASGTHVFGISVDSNWSHKAFARSLGLNYPLLADFNPRGAVAAQYGAFLPERGTSRRMTYLIGPDGVITDVVNYEPGQVPETGPLLTALGAR